MFLQVLKVKLGRIVDLSISEIKHQSIQIVCTSFGLPIRHQLHKTHYNFDKFHYFLHYNNVQLSMIQVCLLELFLLKASELSK
jgi:hypothetical protein